MTDLDRLALRVLQPGFTGPALPDEYADLLAAGLGGVCLFGSNTAGGPDVVRDLCRSIRAADPAAVVAVDEEGGDVTRLHDRSGSPVLGAAALGVVDDVDVTRATGARIGAELAATGIDLTLGPVADVNSNPDNPVIGTRSFGATPDLVARHVSAWVDGVQGAGAGACAKHFPGHGDTAADSHLALPVLDAPAEELAERELVPFAAAVDAGVAAVMTSHIVVTALDAERPATFSPVVLGRLRELGFAGAIVTDALDMAGALQGRTMGEAAVLALLAGADVLGLGPGRTAAEVRAVQAAVVAAVRSGRLPVDRLAEAADRAGALRRTPSARPRPPADPMPGTGSLGVDGDLTALPDLAGARVVTVHTPASIAVGDVPWGLPADVDVTETAPESVRQVASGSAVVVQVRDLHRHAWAQRVVRDLATAADGAPVVVVEWGWPGDWPHDEPRVRTHGWSLPGAAAVTELLREKGWDR
jgi:beta-N-acetylhexosaminidase